MRSEDSFKHEGRVTKVTDGRVEVEMGVIAACEGCKAKGNCISKSGETRVLKVECGDAAAYGVGDIVNIAISYEIGFLAVALCYVAPLIFLVGGLSLFVALGANEGVAALLTLFVVGIYYWMLYREQKRFDRVVKFKIKRKNITK